VGNFTFPGPCEKRPCSPISGVQSGAYQKGKTAKAEKFKSLSLGIGEKGEGKRPGKKKQSVLMWKKSLISGLQLRGGEKENQN